MKQKDVKLKISPGQAILKTYAKVPVGQIPERAKKLYLNGPKSRKVEKNCRAVQKVINLPKETLISVSYEPSTIHNDASRRYFESKLCYKTLISSLDSLESSTSQSSTGQSSLFEYTTKWENYLDKMLGLLKPTTRLMLNVLFAGKADTIPFIDIGRCKTEFNYLFKAKSWLHTAGLSPEKVRCLEVLIKLALVATVVMEERDTNLSCDRDKLEIYKNRGRREKKENHTTRSAHLGLMRSSDPLPYHNDPLVINNESEEAKFLRSADESNYGEDAEWVKRNFSQLLHPFSQSISGTTLAQLRALKYLENIHKKQIFTKNEFILFFKLFIAVLHYFHGGHSLNEFVSVFQLPEVRENFTHIEGFEKIKISTFFYDGNKEVFNDVLEDSIKFNDVILAKEAVGKEIKEKINEKSEEKLELSPSLKKLEEELSRVQKKHIKQVYEEAKEHRDRFEEEKSKLIEIIEVYRKNTKIFSKHGFLGWIAADCLLKNILENTQKIKNFEAKLFVMRAQLKSFIANGQSHFLLPESGTDDGSLRAHIIRKFFNQATNDQMPPANTSRKLPVSKYLRSRDDWACGFGFFSPKKSKTDSNIYKVIAEQKKRQHSHIFTEEGKEYLKSIRQSYNIPAAGVPYYFAYKLAESTYSINIDPSLYAHFRLQVKNGVPCDVFKTPLEDGIYQFVILKNNEFRFLPTKTTDVPKNHYQTFLKYRAHHQIAGGKNVYSAGNFEIKNQKIIWIDGGSGHYGTKEMRFVDYAKAVLSAMGMDTKDIKGIEKPCGWNVTISRLKRQATWFMRGIFSCENDETIEDHPKSDGVWDNKIPRF